MGKVPVGKHSGFMPSLLSLFSQVNLDNLLCLVASVVCDSFVIPWTV